MNKDNFCDNYYSLHSHIEPPPHMKMLETVERQAKWSAYIEQMSQSLAGNPDLLAFR